MKQEYVKPSLEVLGELRKVTAASAGGLLTDLVHGTLPPIGGIPGGS